MYNYSNYYNTTTSANVATGALAGFSFATWIFTIAISVLEIVSMWKIYTKAGKPGWAAIIPVYNIVVLFQITGMNPWLILLLFVPFVNFIAMPVLMIMVYAKLAKAFDKSGGFAVGLIFLNVIFLPILAFSDAEYKGIE